MRRIDPGGRMSQTVVHNRTVYVSGQVADDPSGSIEDQTRAVLAKVDGLLAKAGTKPSSLVAVNVYLPNILDFDAMNRIYDAWIDPRNPPPRACTEARLAHPGLRIEVTAVAATDGNAGDA